MCLNMSEEATLLAPKPIRSPLNTATNTPPKASLLISTKEGKQAVRRKGSFVRRLDSSEDLPSSHDSIFIAEYLSPYNSEESGSGYKLDTWNKSDSPQQIPLSPRLELPSFESNLSNLSSTTSEADENGNQRLNIGITPILYGHGTPLTTIIEQKSSIPTLRESASTTSEIRALARPRSASNLTVSTTSFHAGPLRTGPGSSPLRNLQFSQSGIIRRIHSLSADDSIDSIKLSWPTGYDPQRALWRGKSSMDSESAPTSPINEIYAQPLRPLQPPIDRPATPEGMPSWTAAQHRQPRVANAQGETRRGWNLHEASSMLQRLFSNRSQSGAATAAQEGGTELRGGDGSGYGIRGPWDGVPAHRRTVSAPVLRGAPRFRPPRSAHGVARLEMHPFARAGGVQMSNKSDTIDMNAAPVVVGMARRSASLRHSSSLRNSQGSAVISTAQTVRLVDEAEPQPHHRIVSLRAKGKRKPGQRVRFTPSTADPGTSQRESGTFSDPGVKVCMHKKRKENEGNVQLWDVMAAPLAGAYDASGPLSSHPVNPTVSSSPSEALLLNTDRKPVAQTVPPVPGFSLDGGRSRFRSNERKAKSRFTAQNHCWKCKLENAAEKMDRAWEVGVGWACWYCCGIEDEQRELSIGSSETPVRVRSF